MRKIFVIIFLFTTAIGISQKYTPVDNGSKVHFIIKNFGIKTGGQLSGLKGDIYFFTTDLSACRFNVSVETSTIDTDNDSRDRHLKNADYFDVAQFPQITITSTKIDKTNKTEDGYYYFTGNLTIKGITKPISFPFRVQKENDSLIFTGGFSIDRLDFGVGSSSAVLSDSVNVSLLVSAKRS